MATDIDYSDNGNLDDVAIENVDMFRLEYMAGNCILDPDLASMRSMSLSVRIEMQRERNLQRSIDRERSYLNGFLEKVLD